MFIIQYYYYCVIRVVMKCIYSGNFTENHKKKRKLMGSIKEKALIDAIDKGAASSV